MPRPKRITVNHLTVAVDLRKDETEAMGSSGHYLGDQRRIALSPDLVPDREREVLLHESLHMVVDAALLDWEEPVEENVVRALTGPVLSLIRNNKAFIAYLQE